MKKLHALTGIRGIAALWVIFYHLGHDINFNPYFSIIHQGYLGVDLFFILSGFIISYVHYKNFMEPQSENTARFLTFRLAKILPVHYFMLFVFVCYQFSKTLYIGDIGRFEEIGTLNEFVQNILNIQAWGFTNKLSWNNPAWSISAEWFAYLLIFPLIAPYIQKVKNVLGNLSIILVCLLSLWGIQVIFGKPTLDITSGLALFRVSAEFIMGCALCNIFRWMSDLTKKVPMLTTFKQETKLQTKRALLSA